MILAWSTDGHVGNYKKNGGPEVAGVNQRCEDTLASLGWSVHTAKERKATAYFHLGDLFDYQRIEPQVVARVQKILDIPTALLVGNHDQKSDAYMDHAMAPLTPVADIVDIVPRWFTFGDPGYRQDVAVLMIPFRAGRAEDWLPEVLEAMFRQTGTLKAPNAEFYVLAFHLGISDTQTPYYLDGADDSVCLGTVQKMCQMYGFTHVFAGNWHKYERWTVEGKEPGSEVEVVQIGTLCPNRFSDVGDMKTRFGTMAFMDTVSGKVEIVDVPGPRFIKCTLEELHEFIQDPPPVMQWAAPAYISLTIQPDEQDEAEELLSNLKESTVPAWEGKLRAYEIHVDRSAEDAQANAAVQAAVSATSHEEAIRAFVQASPLEDDVPRDKVQTFVDECLKEAKSC